MTKAQTHNTKIKAKLDRQIESDQICIRYNTAVSHLPALQTLPAPEISD